MHSFFTILNGDCTTQLRIPFPFSNRVRGVIPKKVTLKASSNSNRSWWVDIEEEVDKELYFKRGWNTFVEDNGLEIGEFIVLKYDWNSTFKVKMYAKYACEKGVLFLLMEEGLEGLTKYKNHSFFKVLVDHTTKLQIPLLFNYRFGSVIPKNVTLRTSSYKSWRVDIEEEDKDLYFKRGWTTFVKDNGLEIGEFIVFKYDGNSTFKVKMYAKSGCEKEVLGGTNQINYFDAADANLENHQERKRPIPQEIQRERNPIGENRLKWKLDHEKKKEKEDSDVQGHIGHINKSTAQKEDDRIRKTGMHEKSMQHKAFDGGSKLGSKNPSFKVHLTLAYAEKGVLCMPTDFFLRHMENKKQKVEIETVKGSWTVTVLPHKKRTCTFARISAGWTDCVKGNQFKTGDTLLFEMIRRSNNNCPKFIVSKLRN